MTVQVFIPSGARSRSALAKTINNLVTRKARVGHSELQTRSAHVCIYPMVSAMTSYSNFYVTAHFFVSRKQDQGTIHVEFMKGKRSADVFINRL